MKINIEITEQYGFLTIDFTEPNTGETSRIVEPFSPDEHPEFNERIGNEIYAYWNEEVKK